jgi:signal transduction histidine kinase
VAQTSGAEARTTVRDHRSRLVSVFAVYAVTLIASYVLVVPQVGMYVEDRIFGERVERELARLTDGRERTGAWPAAAPEFMFVAGDVDAPAPLTTAVRALAPGVHELQSDDTGREVELFVGIGVAAGERFALVLDVAPHEVVHGLRDPVFTTVLAIGLAATALATAVALFIARRLFRAIGGLERLARTPRDDAASAEFIGDDEIGRVARALTEAQRLQHEALERERRFTRNASHELRSPITVVKGALELLERRPLDEAAQRALSRIDAATHDMEELVHVFLWLARAPDPSERFDPQPLGDAVALVLDALTPAQRARIALRGHGTTICAPPRVAAVIARNLVANALAHGGDEQVELTIDGARLTVANAVARAVPTAANTGGTGPQPRVADSHGFGLAIVEDLCRRFGWQFTLARTADRVTASVEFGA